MELFALCLWSAKYLSPLIHMVSTAEENVNLLQRNLLRLGDEEPDKHNQQEVGCHEEVKTFQALVLQECREELLKDGIGDVLHLTAHANCLSTNIHAGKRLLAQPDWYLIHVRYTYLKISEVQIQVVAPQDGL